MLPSSSDIIAEWLNLPSVKFNRAINSENTSTVYLDRDLSHELCCSSCEAKISNLWNSERVKLRDLSIFEYKTYLVLDKHRLNCPNCGVKIEKLPFADVDSRCTTRFEELVARLCRMASLKEVADLLDLDWKTVKNIDKKYLEKEFSVPDYEDLELAAVDEISSRKGHNYFTVVMNLKKGKVIWVGKGRREETLDQFFKELGSEKTALIKAFALDMWDAYIASIKKHGPHIALVFDKFHVLNAYSRVINKARNIEYKLARGAHKNVLKGTKYLLLSNRSSLKDDKKKQLKNLLAINENINLTYILKDDLKRIWNYKYPRCAEKLLDSWIKRAQATGLKPLAAFGKTLNNYRYGIINHCRYPINTGKLEGMNNKIKRVKRIAYGFHDDDYFILKIKQACSGNVKSKVSSLESLKRLSVATFI